MNNTIEQLKHVKVPLWAQWLGYWRARQRRKAAHKQYTYIATVYAWVQWAEGGQSRQWYILSENGAGVRSYEYGYERSILRGMEKQHAMYPHFIVPWLNKLYTNEQAVNFAKQTLEPRKVS